MGIKLDVGGVVKTNRSKEDYLFAKSNHICVNCKSESAEPGQTLCWECREKSRERNRKQMEGKTEEEKEKIYKRNRERSRKIYADRKQKGICVKCGKRNSVHRKTLCVDCLIKKRRIKDKRYNNDILRSERPQYGLCYVCGQPICKNSESLCEKHYNASSERMTYLNNHPTEAMLEHRQYIRNLEYARIEAIKERVRNGTFRSI